MKPGTLLRLGLAGSRTDTVRVVLTGLSATLATLAVLTAANVVAIGRFDFGGGGSDEWASQYSNALLREPGLRPGTTLTLLLMTIPVFALAGQCARIGAPERDRRLAAYRLAGATPAQTVAISAAESGFAALTGSLAGLGIFAAGHRLLHRPGPDGLLPLPTDVWPAGWFLAVAVAGIPALAALSVALVMRRVTVSPFGVVRRVRRTRGPQPWAGLFILLGALLLGAVTAPAKLHQYLHIPFLTGWRAAVLLFAGVASAGLGVVLGTGWLTWSTGRLLARWARKPSTVLASARLVADPWSGSRTLAVLLICVLFGAGAAGIRAQFEAMASAERASNALLDPALRTERDPFYLRTMDLIDLAVYTAIILTALAMLVIVAEGVVSRRREYAALVATGVPRGPLGRAILWQGLLPAIPAVLLALVVGVGLTRTLGTQVEAGGGRSHHCLVDDEQVCRTTTPSSDPDKWRLEEDPTIVREVQIPWRELTEDGAVALLSVLATTGVGVLFLRRSTDLSEIRTT
ncbi:FtsX-like permease family protein [Dactylosporangium sp. NPDC051541]|uniref:FtsX-like permease family protein n=1 Tax=Dactylosporangium sp. NPDC051541 TaxID=3363977 RepID=UPI00379B3887